MHSRASVDGDGPLHCLALGAWRPRWRDRDVHLRVGTFAVLWVKGDPKSQLRVIEVTQVNPEAEEFSGWYNIYNKQALNILKLPWFVATAQMGMGFLIFLPMWMLKLRERPASDLADFKSVLSSLLAVGFYQVMQFPVIDFLFIYIYLLLA